MPDSPERLTAAVRDLIEVVRISDLSDLALADTTDALRAITDGLRPHVVDGVRMQSSLDVRDLLARPEEFSDRIARLGDRGVSGVFPYSPYVGTLNPLAPPARVEIVGAEPWRELAGEVEFGDAYNGPPGGVHGGVLAGLFDELLGAVCVVNDVGGFTGTLTVRYRAPSPLGKTIQFRAWIDRVEGRKTFAAGSFHHGDTLLLEGEGVFIGSDRLPLTRGAGGE